MLSWGSEEDCQTNRFKILQTNCGKYQNRSNPPKLPKTFNNEQLRYIIVQENIMEAVEDTPDEGPHVPELSLPIWQTWCYLRRPDQLHLGAGDSRTTDDLLLNPYAKFVFLLIKSI